MTQKLQKIRKLGELPSLGPGGYWRDKVTLTHDAMSRICGPKDALLSLVVCTCTAKPLNTLTRIQLDVDATTTSRRAWWRGWLVNLVVG